MEERHRRWLLDEFDKLLQGWVSTRKSDGRRSPGERAWYWRLDQHVRVLHHLGVQTLHVSNDLVRAVDPDYDVNAALARSMEPIDEDEDEDDT